MTHAVNENKTDEKSLLTWLIRAEWQQAHALPGVVYGFESHNELFTLSLLCYTYSRGGFVFSPDMGMPILHMHMSLCMWFALHTAAKI